EQTQTAAAAVLANPATDFVADAAFGGLVAELETDESVTIPVVVPAAGLYEIAFDFVMPEAFYTVPTVALEVNGESPFNEASSLELDVAWNIIPLAENERFNRYGNELLPDAEAIRTWSTYWIDDYNALTSGACLFLLESGINPITVTALNLSVRIGAIRIRGHVEPVSYAAYRANVAALPDEADGALITIQGENFAIKNDLEIKSSYYKESAMTPYAYMTTVLNRLDGGSMARGGTKVTYAFDVEKSGNYKFALKAFKNENAGVAAAKTFYLDGVIPFAELEAYTFDTLRKWTNVTLGNGEAFELYLTAGSHTLTIESTAAAYVGAIDRLNTVMDGINAISLTVQTITGGNTDDAVDWNFLKYLPDLEET
ncbi:MAG: hypothetical protein Q8N15_02535, partial [Bacillota bacterium]|nr:hypothetical protein [Bacillota bacterium]